MTKLVTVNIRLYSGIDQEIGIVDYHHQEGINLVVPEKTSLKKALKQLGYRPKKHHAVFCNGERISHRYKLLEGDQVSLIVPTPGG